MKHLARFARCLAACASMAFAAPIAANATTTLVGFDCDGPEYRRFDFWIGDWDVFEADARGEPAQARATVERVAGGCAIRERYEQADGLVGESLLSYDAAHARWQQTWVTNRGSLMRIAGTSMEGAMVLEGETHLKDGTSVRQRITWRKEGSDVRESALVSKDDGRTWTSAFDMVFRRRAAGR